MATQHVVSMWWLNSTQPAICLSLDEIAARQNWQEIPQHFVKRLHETTYGTKKPKPTGLFKQLPHAFNKMSTTNVDRGHGPVAFNKPDAGASRDSPELNERAVPGTLGWIW